MVVIWVCLSIHTLDYSMCCSIETPKKSDTNMCKFFAGYLKTPHGSHAIKWTIYLMKEWKWNKI